MKRVPFLLLFFCFLFMISCENIGSENNDDPEPEKAQTDQEGNAAADEAIDDVNDIIDVISQSNARVKNYNLPCGVVSIDSSQTTSSGQTIYKVKYGAQTPCGYRKKSGEVSFHLEKGNHFAEKGATFSIILKNYKVEVLATGNTVTLNGSFKITNQEGGAKWQVVVESKTIVHQVRGSFLITYHNNEVRPREYYRLKTYTSSSGWEGLSLTITGDTLIDNIKVMDIGKTLEGNHDYTTEVFEDFVWKNCGTNHAGPFVLKLGHGRGNAKVPGISPVYFDVEAGYFVDVKKGNIDAYQKVNDCTSNAYKITTVIGNLTQTTIQLY
jgi:hypothetical protein